MNTKLKSTEAKSKVSKSKKLRAVKESFDGKIFYNITDAIELLKKNTFVKFDETLEIAMNLGIDPKQSDQMVRGLVNLRTGKTARVLVICKDERIAEAKNAGADIAGSTEVLEDIKAGKINFDVCIATPDMMGLVGGVARILGPKGLMPNPKLGTVTTDITTAIKNAKSGQVEFRVEKAGIIHAGIGKLSFSVNDLLNNVRIFVSAIQKAKPTGAKGTYVEGLHLSSTMGPSIKVDLATIA